MKEFGARAKPLQGWELEEGAARCAGLCSWGESAFPAERNENARDLWRDSGPGSLANETPSASSRSRRSKERPRGCGNRSGFFSSNDFAGRSRGRVSSPPSSFDHWRTVSTRSWTAFADGSHRGISIVSSSPRVCFTSTKLPQRNGGSRRTCIGNHSQISMRRGCSLW